MRMRALHLSVLGAHISIRLVGFSDHRSKCSGMIKSTAMPGRHTVSRPEVMEVQKAAPDKLKIIVHVCNSGSAE